VKVTLPADVTSAITEVGALASLLDKNGWKAAAFIAVSCKPGTAGRPSQSATSSRLSFTAFAKALNAKGWSKDIINRHYEAWERAADAGLVDHADDLVFGERIEVPTEDWASYYPPPTEADDRYQIEDKDEIMAAAAAEGLTGSKAVDIAKNTKSMAAAIKASPRVREAAAQALVDAEDVTTLANATAAASQNRRVKRRRERLADGMAAKGGSVEDHPRAGGTGTGGLGSDPVVGAMMSDRALSTALRAVNTDFPQEWANHSQEVRDDPDYCAATLESLDSLEMGIANARAIVNGISDEALAKLLNGGGGNA
jgi:hypothetical protein